MVRPIARVDGYMVRKRDREPGMTVLWSGWMRLYGDMLMSYAAKRALGRADSR